MQKNKTKLRIRFCTLMACISLMGTMPAFAGTWQQDAAQGGKYMQEDSTKAVGWICEGRAAVSSRRTGSSGRGSSVKQNSYGGNSTDRAELPEHYGEEDQRPFDTVGLEREDSEKNTEQTIPLSTPSDAQLSNPVTSDDKAWLDNYMKEGLLLDADDQPAVEEYLDSIIYGKGHTAILIGKNFYPYSEKLNGSMYPVEGVSLRTEELHIEGDTYHVFIYSITYPHEHSYEELVTPPACTESGLRQMVCNECGDSVDTVLSRLGHIDADGDSVCDRCQTALDTIELGTALLVGTGLPGDYARMEFVCVDEDYQGGYLFLSSGIIPYGTAPAYGTTGDYTNARLRSWLNSTFYEGLSVSGRIQKAEIKESTDVASDYVFCLSKEEITRYSDIAMQPWTPETGSMAYWMRSQDEELSRYAYAVTADGHFSSQSVKDRSIGARPAFILKRSDTEEPEGRVYVEGDTQERVMDGQSYVFRCIDSDYADAGGEHIGALFLCDSVIGGNYSIFDHDTNSWADSQLRAWLSEGLENDSDLVSAETTISNTYSGRTSFYGNSLVINRFTRQPLDGTGTEDKIFCLSLEEAVRYKNYLWRLDGASQDNYVETGTHTAGYWLRSAYTYDEGMAYSVTSEGEITAIQVDNDSVGFRPAYVIGQK